MSGLWRTKSVEQSIQDTDEPGHKLKRTLSAWDLTVFGVAVVIGAGIFTLTARVAATTAGPSVSIAFVIAAIACGLAAMCYAEFASTVPVAGSAYTFSYATLGELIAWIIGWDLVLELALGASVVSKGWSLLPGQPVHPVRRIAGDHDQHRADRLRLGRRADRRGDHLASWCSAPSCPPGRTWSSPGSRSPSCCW